MNAIEIRNLSKTLDKFTLNIDNLDIKKGFITGFIGPNGNGKTTTIKLIMNMLNKDTGSIKIFGKEFKTDDLSIKETIGYIGDISGYMKEVKLKEIKKSLSSFYKNWDEDLYKYYLTKFNIDENKLYKECSKGQQKKFELIMALCHHPRLLIMDEPTANLDPIVRNEFIDVLQEHIDKDGVTVFYSTHITSDLDKVCDYLVFVYDGKIILNGDKESLLESHRVIRGNKDLLNDETKKSLISYKENSFGFDALTSDYKATFDIFGEEVIYDKANLEDILMYYTRR